MDDRRLPALYDAMVDRIECDSKDLRNLPITDNEEQFFKALLMECDKIGMSRYLKLQRLSNKSFNVWCNCYVGKIKLQGRDTYMQYLNLRDSVYLAENNPLRDYIKLIKKWIKYIEHCNKSRV